MAAQFQTDGASSHDDLTTAIPTFKPDDVIGLIGRGMGFQNFEQEN